VQQATVEIDICSSFNVMFTIEFIYLSITYRSWSYRRLTKERCNIGVHREALFMADPVQPLVNQSLALH